MSETALYHAKPDVRWFQHNEGLQRAVIFEPGYNDRGGKYGVHGMGIRWLLRGKYGAVQFLMNAGWVPGEKMRLAIADCFPTGFNLGYHALVPHYEGQDSMGPCEYLDGKECFYDGSGLAADDLMHEFIREGERVVWEKLESRYADLAEFERGAGDE